MLAAMAIVTGISIYQMRRSGKALSALKIYTESTVTVVREGMRKRLPAHDLVPGDLIVLEEGELVPADAEILEASDLTINDSIITGESLPVEKHAGKGSPLLFQGTIVNSGSCYARVKATGNETVIGRMGKQIDTHTSSRTLLQRQITGLVRPVLGMIQSDSGQNRPKQAQLENRFSKTMALL